MQTFSNYLSYRSPTLVSEMAKAKGLTATRGTMSFNQQDHDFYDEVAGKTNAATANKAFMARWAYLHRNGESPEYNALFKNHGIYLKDVREDVPGSPGILVYRKGKASKNKDAEVAEAPVHTYIGELRQRVSAAGMLADIHRYFEDRIDMHGRNAEGHPDIDAAWDRISKGKDTITYDDFSDDDVQKFKPTLKELGIIGSTSSQINKEEQITKNAFKRAFKKAFLNDILHGNVPINLQRQARQKAPGDPKYGGWTPNAKSQKIATGEEGEVETSKLKEIQSDGQKKVNSWFLGSGKNQTTIPDGEGGYFSSKDLESMARSRLGNKFNDMWGDVLIHLGRHVAKLEKLTEPGEAAEYYLKNVVASRAMGPGSSHAEKQSALLKKMNMGGEMGARGSDGESEMNFDVDGVTKDDDDASSIADLGKDVVHGPEQAAKNAYLLMLLKQYKSDSDNRKEVAAETGTIVGTPSFNKAMQAEAIAFITQHKEDILNDPEAKAWIEKKTERLKNTIQNKDTENKNDLQTKERRESYARLSKELEDLGMDPAEIKNQENLAIKSYDSPEAKEQFTKDLTAKLSHAMTTKDIAAQSALGALNMAEKSMIARGAEHKAKIIVQSFIKDLHSHATKAAEPEEVTRRNVDDKIDRDEEHKQLANLYNKSQINKATPELTTPSKRELTPQEIQAIRDKKAQEIEADDDDLAAYRNRRRMG